ncbi:CDGSH iron-sulfur domain-containing protein [Roseospira navarrensis]|uniref:CDGSH iron-sulfur domain-containing protein n=1 Tax=Roseospira navarrensis TaxID=140058 RepID=A0A7X1ZDE4_9PROT|nr:CDGSH iron-sulfur domain-containing protein [Roseospira navarrensis]MQX35989.1 CDGSH iron-sulfur domain-containing protein [Roseospira navarrensis]
MTETEPTPPSHPFEVTLSPGKTYFWCVCGRSAKQPFCDGGHKGTGLAPRKVTVEAEDTVFLCGCKQTATPPYCDGTHTTLS